MQIDTKKKQQLTKQNNHVSTNAAPVGFPTHFGLFKEENPIK